MSQELDKVPDALSPEPAGTGSRAFASGFLSWPQMWGVILAGGAVLALLGQMALGPRSTGGLYLPAVAFLVCALAAWYDAATQHIPNPITYTAILLGLGLNMLKPVLVLAHADLVVQWLGAVGPLDSLAGFAVCAVIGLSSLMFGMRGMGGGDIKVLGALGALLGLHRAGCVMFVALTIAVPYALINLALMGRLNAVIRLVMGQLMEIAYLKKTQSVEAVSAWYIPVSVPLLLGLVVSGTPMAQALLRSLGFI